MINTIKQAKEFLEQDNQLEDINLVTWKWEVKFLNTDDILRFFSDEELINWCEEQRLNTEIAKNEN